MEPDSPFNDPVSSYQSPVPILSIDPDEAPLEVVRVNSSWLAYLRGCAQQLLLQSTWDTTDLSVLALAQKRAFLLIGLLQDQGEIVGIPTGGILDWSTATPPSGFLVCDGSLISRATYAALFAVIGTLYGAGNGSTTFQLPDLRGRTSIGAGQGSGLTNRTLAALSGEETHQLSSSEMPSHTHPTYPSGSTGSRQYYSVGASNGSNTPNTGTLLTFPTGGDAAHNNMSPYLVLNKIIKT